MSDAGVQTGKVRLVGAMAMLGFLGIVLIAAWIGLGRVEEHAREGVGDALSIVLETTRESLRTWRGKEVEDVERLAHDPRLVALSRPLLEAPRTPEALLASDALRELRAFFEANWSGAPAMGFFLIAPDGISIASARDANVGSGNLIAERRPDLLRQAFAGESMFIPPVPSDVGLSDPSGQMVFGAPTMFFAAPVRSEDGQVMAVLAVRIDPRQDFSRMLLLGRIGRTGETYAFDRDGVLLSQTRFEDRLRELGLLPEGDRGALSLRITDPGVDISETPSSIPRPEQGLTKMAAEAVAGRSGVDVAGYRDYRGVRVLGAWAWDDDLELGVAAEIDEREALAAYRSSRTVIVGGLAVTALLALLLTALTLWSGERASRSLQRARDDWERVAEERTAELAASEKRSRMLLEAAPDAMVIVDDEGVVTTVNAACERLFGYSREELLGRPVEVLVPDGSRELHPELRRDYSRAPDPRGMGGDRELWGQRKDGTRVPIEVGLSPLETEEGRVVVAAIRDVTERRRAEHELRKLSRVTESSPASVVVTDLDGTIEYVNPKFTEVTGYTPDEAVGQNPRILNAGVLSAEFYAEMWRTLAAGEEWTGEFCNKKKDGEVYWEHATISPIRDADGAVTHYVAVKEDITERRRAAEALRAAESDREMALEAAQVGLWMGDLRSETWQWDARVNRMMGLAEDAPADLEAWTAALHPEDRDSVLEEFGAAIRGEKVFDVEYRVVWPDGSVRHIAARGKVSRDAGGNPVRIDGITYDVTALRAAEQVLQEILGQSPVAVCITRDAVVRLANPRFKTLFGLEEGDAVPQNYVDIRDREHMVSEIRAGREVQAFEFQAYGANGHVLDLLGNFRAVEYQGQPGVLAWLVDITDVKTVQRQLRQSEERFALTTSGSGDGLWDFDLPAKSFWYSDRFRELLGYSDENDYPNHLESWSDGLHAEDREATLAAFEAHLEKGSPYDVEYRLRTKQGEWRWFRARGRSLRDESGRSYRAAGSITDITEQKRLEMELSVARARAEDASRAKGDFLANMSHEIRTPMNAVIGLSHLALQTELTAKQHDYLAKIESSAGALLGIINDILDFSKIEAGRLELETIDFSLDEVLSSVSTLVATKCEDKRVELLLQVAPDVPRSLRGDPLRLGQVLTNLASNAVKFTDEGEVVIALDVDERRADAVRLRFSVRDTGIGMTEEQRARLFQAFSQADTTTTRKYGGTGLGLSIASRLTEMMDGEIFCESRPGEGSTFTFTARFGIGEGEASEPLQPHPDLRGTRALVVDDNATARDILQGLLEGLSFQVGVAGSAREGLGALEAAAGSAPFGLVLMDWQMPGMDGFAASARIREDPRRFGAPRIVMVTAYGREEVISRAESEGLDGFLIKPVTPSLLFDAVMQAFGKQTGSPAGVGRRRTMKATGLETSRGARVLLAEDNEINQQVATELLEQAGLVVEVARNGREAVEAATADGADFDVVLMDIQMPELDGLEATRLIRQSGRPGSEALPIIAMTAHAMAGDRERSLEAGMNDHVTKPIDPGQLFDTLARWIAPGRRDGAVEAIETPRDTELEEDDRPLEGLSGISVQSGLDRVAGNRQLYRKLLVKFRKSHAGAVDDLRRALEANDRDAATRIAHSVKGVAGNLGADALSRSAGVLEKRLKAGGTPPPEEALREVEERLEEVMCSIAELEPRPHAGPDGAPESASGRPIDTAAVGPLLVEMADLLEFDLIEAAERLEGIRAHLEGSGAGEAFERLAAHVDDFDMAGAIEALREIAGMLSIPLSGSPEP